MKVMKIPCGEVIADPESNVSRDRLSPMECQELAASIQMHGLQQPVIVRSVEGGYKLVAGFRRFTAVSVNLGLEEIDAIITETTVSEQINLIENLQRKDLSFWEECCALKATFEEGTPMVDIQAALSKSKSWVRARWYVWNLPDEVIGQVEAGLLGFTDVAMLVQDGVDVIAAASKLIAGKAAGKTTHSLRKDITHVRNNRGKKEVQKVMTRCLEKGRMEAVQALRFSIGEIEEKTLMNWLSENPTESS